MRSQPLLTVFRFNVGIDIYWNNFVGFKTNLTSYNYGYAYSMFYEHLISMDNYMPINM